MDTHVAGEHALVITRLMPATPEAVFAAWTEPARVKAWWGPYGMTTPMAEIDLRPGGHHVTLMRDAAGKEYPNRLAIDAVEAPHRLVVRVTDESCGPLVGAIGTIRVLPAGDLTRLEVSWHHPTAEMRAAHAEMGFAKGWGETLDRLTAHLCTQAPACPGATPPTPEHGWLHRLLGTWRYDTACTGLDGTPLHAQGLERVHSLGGYWIVGESEGEMPGGGPARWTVTVGFDAAAQRFRGTFVGSMMPHMFVYEGTLSEDGRRLVLETTGPAMDGKGSARYRDSLEMVGDDRRIATSDVENPDGSWTRFMTSQFHRVD